MSPYGKVPVVVHDGRAIFESAICNEYLEEVYPQQALMPADAFARAQVRIWTDYAAAYFSPPSYRILRSEDARVVQESWEELHKQLAYVERHLAAADDGWFVAGRFTLADINILPFVHRIATQLPGDVLAGYPALGAWYARFKARPSFQTTLTEQPPRSA
ncbi:MAG: glutathione S-transferase family protein [Candidatus Lambdaproteobacteria bacterium]|nr:glutathione S-transferase family protein [Candidatus Lambdaproteobacteria bacterium]